MLRTLFEELQTVFDSASSIERHAINALQDAIKQDEFPILEKNRFSLSKPFLDVLEDSSSHPICNLISKIPFVWEPPNTSADQLYIEHSEFKVHVELIGPEGLISSNAIRLGLYGMLPDSEYGVRTHPAEEVFVMLAGNAYWRRGDRQYILHGVGEKSYHPSEMPHATKTHQLAFMSVYAWSGDISTKNYVYRGI